MLHRIWGGASDPGPGPDDEVRIMDSRLGKPYEEDWVIFSIFDMKKKKDHSPE